MNICKKTGFILVMLCLTLAAGCGGSTESRLAADLAHIEYTGESFAEVNGNVPSFAEDEITTRSFESYSDLDSLGRCGAAFACVGTDIMPTEERGAIGQVKPSGWQLAKYDIVDGKYLYNRCHLIGYQLTGENANEKNLITGTRYMNVSGMLPYENTVADYVESTKNHVMYRVTPIFDGSDLVAKGVQMEALSVEDGGAGVSFNVFVFNVQPGIEINYADGTSKPEGETGDTAAGEEKAAENTYVRDEAEGEYILNLSTKKIHRADCGAAESIAENNREVFNGPKQYLLDNGYTECGKCKP